MTPRQQEMLIKFWPLALTASSLLVGWTTIKRDVQDLKEERLPSTRFEAESIRVHNELAQLRELRALVRGIAVDADLLPRICAAVKCAK